MEGRANVVVNLVAAAFMAGLIWYVQVVHYPLMAGWPHDDFPRWESMHRARTAPVVMPVMLAEGAAAAWLAARRPEGVARWVPWVGIGLLVVIWGSTFFVQVPCHDALARGWDSGVHAKLVATNWIRTLAWTGRVLVLSVGLAAAVGSASGGGR